MFFLSSSAFRRSELFGQRSKVHIFDEGYAPRGRDSSYIGLFISFELLFLVDFGTMLCLVYDMGQVCSRFKGYIRDEFGLKHCVYRRCQNAPACCSVEATQLRGSCNPRAHYCMGLTQ